MPLLAYNLTNGALGISGVPGVTLPPAPTPGARGPAVNVTGELKGQSPAVYAAAQTQVDAGQIEYEWTTLPEYNTFTLQVGSAAADIALQPLTLYIDPTGSDSNNGLDPSTPLATPGAAWLLLTSSTRFNYGFIQCAPGTYSFDAATGGVYVNGSNGKAQATPPLFIGAFSNEVGTRTTTAADPNGVVLTDSSLTMTPNQYKGLWVVCTSAANAVNVGARMQIAANDATSVTMSLPLPAPVSIGDQFEIQQPTVIFQLNRSCLFGYATNFVGFLGIKFDLQGHRLIFIDGARAMFDGVLIDGPGGFVSWRGAYVISSDWPLYAPTGPANPLNPNSTNGAFFRNLLLTVSDGTALTGIFAFENGVLFPEEVGGQVILVNPVATNFGFTAGEDGFLYILDGSGGLCPIVLDGPDPFGFFSAQTTVYLGSSADLESYSAIHCPGPAITAELGSYVYAQTVTGGATLGTGAAATLVPGAAPGNTRVAGLSGVPATAVGSFIQLSGSATPGNNGIFQIAAFVDPTQVDVVQNGGGFPTAPDAGPLAWTINENGDVGIQVDSTSKASALYGTAVTGLAGDTRIAGTPKAYAALPYVEPNTLGFITNSTV